MRRSILVIAAMLAVCGIPAASLQSPEPKSESSAKAKPEDAKKLLSAAYKKAASQKKNIFVLFDASW